MLCRDFNLALLLFKADSVYHFIKCNLIILECDSDNHFDQDCSDLIEDFSSFVVVFAQIDYEFLNHLSFAEEALIFKKLKFDVNLLKLFFIIINIFADCKK